MSTSNVFPPSTDPLAEAGPVKDAVRPVRVTSAMTLSENPEAPAQPAVITIVPGYRPSILARTLEMHMDCYYPRYGWGRECEAVFSQALGDLLARLNKPMNQVWSAVSTTPTRDSQGTVTERIVGAVYIDGECSKMDGVARLRFFIVDESTRGLGVGKKLFETAMEFVRETNFHECQLSTLSDLTVARRLYEAAGFKEAGENWVEGLGKGHWQMNYIWRRSDEPKQA
ncbi:acyl-CoA N-acyltransferase [Parathielavia appendiculata]|uniref:Acyl-CoA N-acyltransferase n=1 Tax=Parathielavia appendiculata TaxID=2587402 RepID=A0AAN6Z755_9PEZI|nr:acyl-CoA N-acyltransferase [Parathielavia appendiculata]